MDAGLQGKVAVVTGGSGGIGSAVVRALASEGARVAVHYRRNERRALELAQATGGVALSADLTVEAEVDELFEWVGARLGPPEILVANAGIWPRRNEPVWEMSYGRWRETLRANLDSVFLSCRAFLRVVAETGRGNIVLVSSTAGIFGEAGHADYAAAKGALATGLLLSLKNEIVRVAPAGRVNAVAPGWTATDMTREELADASFVRRITRTMALDRVADADDVARVVVALASDAICGHVTGQVVTVAGGMEGRVLREG